MNLYITLFAILAFITGASFASFAGVIAFRIPKGMSIVAPDSFCPECKKPIKFYDNIPILSWIFLGGKCRYCKEKIPVFSFVNEILGGFGFMLAYFQYGNSKKLLPLLVAIILLTFLFLIIAAIDYETHDIYNITLIIFAIISIFITTYRVFFLGSNIWDHLIGSVFGFGFFASVKLISKIKLKKEGLGAGDVYIVGIAGLMLGVIPLVLSILIGSLLALIVEPIKAKGFRLSENEIAFAPYLLLGIETMALFGDVFMNYYWKVIINVFL